MSLPAWLVSPTWLVWLASFLLSFSNALVPMTLLNTCDCIVFPLIAYLWLRICLFRFWVDYLACLASGFGGIFARATFAAFAPDSLPNTEPILIPNPAT